MQLAYMLRLNGEHYTAFNSTEEMREQIKFWRDSGDYPHIKKIEFVTSIHFCCTDIDRSYEIFEPYFGDIRKRRREAEERHKNGKGNKADTPAQ